MPKKARQREPYQHPTLVCKVKTLTYDWTARTGLLYFPPANCCDMGGAIDLFTAIDPEVLLILTFAGDEHDTVYARSSGGQWVAGGYNPCHGMEVTEVALWDEMKNDPSHPLHDLAGDE
jgi:hypothetical protein